MGPVGGNLAGLGHLELDDLLTELRSRAVAAQASHDRLGQLLDAVVAVGSDLDLPEVLLRITRSACDLVGARYGALGVLGGDGERLVEFITHGVNDDERAKIGDLPSGHGVLGLLIRDPRTRRIADIGAHPDSFGFPPGHPPMASFIGTPITTRGEVFGNLYIAEKLGGGEFTTTDESVLEALAAAAGVAIENARLYDLSRRRSLWSDAARDLTHALLTDDDEDGALEALAAAVKRVTGAASVGVALDDGDLLLLRPVGDAIEAKPLKGPLWEGLRTARQPVRFSPAGPSGLATGAMVELASLLGADRAGEGVIAPLARVGDRTGVLLATWAPESSNDVPLHIDALGDVAQQAGLALLAGRARRDEARMSLLDDRARIARDMHDHVIQRLFATGLSLQAATVLAGDATVRERLDTAVDELDAAIKEIRLTIFQLQDPRARQLGEHLHHLVQVLSHGPGPIPVLTLDPALTSLPTALVDDLVAVVREGLSNAVRHARASTVTVDISQHEGQVVVRVEDDGVGLDPGQVRSGLVNLGDRAARRDGAFMVERREPNGTLLRWRAPMRER
ncbi:MAG: GAF domain-containing protein [Actinomycetota bacterium]|nr:GAF domain-containing protein [Actinomycetota bacterium]